MVDCIKVPLSSLKEADRPAVLFVLCLPFPLSIPATLFLLASVFHIPSPSLSYIVKMQFLVSVIALAAVVSARPFQMSEKHMVGKRTPVSQADSATSFELKEKKMIKG